jgi:cellulose synthase/poly-beta-1,6-N-acetylglucosamine synthase-like glycosyltransferase/spore germination protein YaaH/peptidoglycan/xylan/chitin deacetylase (PgdA/CDA1 family)
MSVAVKTSLDMAQREPDSVRHQYLRDTITSTVSHVFQTPDRPGPVFFDKTGRRWMLCLTTISAVALAIVAGAGLFVAGLFYDPRFPGLKIDDTNFSRMDERNEQLGVPGTLAKTAFVESVMAPAEASTPRHGARPAARTTRPPVIFGFHVPWDENSLVSLKSNSSHLTHVLAEWLILQNGDGDLQDHTEIPVVEWSRQEKIPVLTVVTNFRNDQWRAGELHQILSNPAARHRLALNIYASVHRYSLAGANIDFEQVPITDRSALTAFIRDLHDTFKREGLILTQDVPTDDPHMPAYDMKALSQLNDYVIPMIYDEHFAAGAPGPVASLPWLRDQVQEVLKALPPEKTVIGLGNFGYDWTLGSTRSAVEVGFSDVISRANQYHGTIEWHSGLKNAFLHYTKAGVQHEVWFLDAVTGLNSIRDVHEQGFAGVSFWRLGAEDPSLWKLFGDRSWPSADFANDSLASLGSIEGVRQYGRGEAIRVTQTKSSGHRRVWRDEGDFNEIFDRVPTGDVVEAVNDLGAKLLTLTFDDGPDPRYTPRILDILKEKHVPATFFVVGGQAEKSADLLRRIYAEGHDIGNHTYSHGNDVLASDAKLGLELNMTQRIVEQAIGRSTTLFRSPYKGDSDLRTSEAIQSALRPQRLGYTTIGERVDPRDWEAKSSDEVLDIVMRDKNLGNIVLLHDGGGDREATIQALPTMIDQLRAEGYRFVSLEELLGRSRVELMPPMSLTERGWALVEGGPMIFRQKALFVVKCLFLTAIALALLRTLVYGFLGVLQKIHASKRRFEPGFEPPVSVIIAAYNEEKIIAKTVAAVLESNYPDFEIIVVDDGSTDGTLETLRREFSSCSAVRILTQPNGGKAAALNLAISEANHEFVVALDADTLFCPGTIGNLIRHFSTPKVAAVSGNVKVGNPKKWIARFQSIEYVCGFNLDRRALDLLNAVAVVPGAAGAWRKSAVIEAGGYPRNTVAEDTDLTLAIRRRGHVIRYDEHAIAYTEVPETITALARQRLRWAFGTLQSAWKHRDTTFRRRYGTMAFITLPSIWLYQFMFAGISPMAEIALLLALIGLNTKMALTYYGIFFAAELLTAMLAYALECENPLNLSLLFFQRLLYPRLMFYVVGKSLLFAAGGRAIGWGVHVRRATVKIGPQRYAKPVLEKAV